MDSITPLFKKAICFTDVHFGLKHNSREHNQDCLDFIDWMVAEGAARNVDTCIFLGDYHHDRSTLNISTLHHSLEGLRKLNEGFKNTYIIVGNHDLFYKEKRSITSLKISSEFENIHLVNEPFIKDDVAILPWLVDNEWKTVSKINAKYIFGHFEIPGFRLNAAVEMPDTGELNSDHFVNPDYVFSGHFHKRQSKGKVHYIGNPFGHNYSDAGDYERGAMYLEWGSEPQYINYTSGPRYVSINISELIENPDHYLKPKTFAKVYLNVDISYEEANFLKETFISSYDVRDIKLVPLKQDEYQDDTDTEITFESVDEIVIEQLSAIQSDNFDKNELIKIYNDL